MWEVSNKFIKKVEKMLYKAKKESDNFMEIFKNYKTDEYGNITIKADYIGRFDTWYDNVIIPKSSIISITNENIVCKKYKTHFNHKEMYIYACDEAIKEKENLVEYKETQIVTYKYTAQNDWTQTGYWKQIKTDVVGEEVISEKTPLEVFKKDFDSKYKLIETEDEFNEYMASTLDCNTWCRKKLYNKMKELGLGNGFINQFADLIGNDLDKYHAMIELANEVTDKDTLMYLYTYKFSNN